MKAREIVEKLELYILSLWLLFFLVIIVTADIRICSGDPCEFLGWRVIVANNVVPLISATFLLAGVIYYFRFDYRIAGSTSIPVTISEVQDLNYEHLTFLTTYIIPLICFNLTNGRYLLALVILLIIIGVIYVKTDKFYANPTLAVLGFRLYSATVTRRTGKTTQAVIITKARLREDSLIRYLQLDDRVLFAKEA